MCGTSLLNGKYGVSELGNKGIEHFNRGRIAEYHRIKKVLSFDYDIRIAGFDEIVQSLLRSEVLEDNYRQQLAIYKL